MKCKITTILLYYIKCRRVFIVPLPCIHICLVTKIFLGGLPWNVVCTIGFAYLYFKIAGIFKINLIRLHREQRAISYYYAKHVPHYYFSPNVFFLSKYSDPINELLLTSMSFHWSINELLLTSLSFHWSTLDQIQLTACFIIYNKVQSLRMYTNLE